MTKMRIEGIAISVFLFLFEIVDFAQTLNTFLSIGFDMVKNDNRPRLRDQEQLSTRRNTWKSIRWNFYSYEPSTNAGKYGLIDT